MEKPFWMICVTHMFLEVLFLVPVALIPVYIQDFQVSVLEASLVATAPSLVRILMNIPSGFLADKFSTKHLLFASMVIEGISALLVSQTTNFFGLVLGLSVMMIASPIYHTSGLSQISRLVNRDRISRSMGAHNALGSLGTALGSLSLVFFLSTSNWRWTYIFWAIPQITWGIIVLRSSQLETKMVEKKETKKRGRPGRVSLVFSAGFLTLLIALAVRMVGFAGVSTFATTYFVETRGLTADTASLIFGLGPLAGIVGSLIGGYLGEKMGAKKALSLSVLGCVVSLLMLAFSSQFYLLALFYIVYALSANSTASPQNTIVSNITPMKRRGFSFSIIFLTEGLTSTIAPPLTAGIIELSAIWFLFPFSIVLSLASLIVLQFFRYPKSN